VSETLLCLLFFFFSNAAPFGRLRGNFISWGDVRFIYPIIERNVELANIKTCILAFRLVLRRGEDAIAAEVWDMVFTDIFLPQY
jgi:hypothetical protein